ncbi:diguanylate cyclase [Methylocaldum marinum]|uniref:Diguanylate cyclase n=1 Tax=Methylocaldum marinum TaxID=1432792 RepID=A0A250KWW8_9GAMM|nr:diguanylate cyclase [Methylocaldum marinum]BBA36178.1 diguanylate cyclase [Methylocaldum marinum]
MILTRVLTLIVILSVGALGEFVARLEKQSAEREHRNQVLSVVGALRASLESELNATLHLTQGMIAYVATGSTLEPEVIEPMLKTLYEYGRHVRNIGLAPGNRLTYIYPLEGNDGALGLYYPDLKEQWPAVERTIRERKPRLAGPRQLMQGGLGLIYRIPVFLGAREEYWGLLSMVIDVDSLYARVGIAPTIGGLQLALRGLDGTGAQGDTFLGNAGLFQTDAVTAEVITPGGTWQMAARPATGWGQDKHIGWLRAGFWFVGMLLGGSLHQVMLFATRRQQLTEQLRQRTSELEQSHSRLIAEVDERKRLEEELRHFAFYDALTRLPNRRLFLDRLHQAQCNSARHKSHVAVMFLDLNNFKELNDTHGHDIGDRLLIDVARRLQRAVRESDTVARLGGDEFVVMLEGLGPEAETARMYANAIADNIREQLNQEYVLHDIRHHCSASIGVKLFLGTNEDPDQILKDADTEMYRVKQRCGRPAYGCI